MHTMSPVSVLGASFKSIPHLEKSDLKSIELGLPFKCVHYVHYTLKEME